MNIYGKSLEEIQSNTGSLIEYIDPLPGVPDKLSLKQTAYILGVSVQTIERMIDEGGLKTTLNGDLQKSDLEAYFSCHTLADIPVMQKLHDNRGEELRRKEMPKRIQRKRTKGWRMPSNTVYVGRGSKWGNPFKGVNAYENYMMLIPLMDKEDFLLEPLKGKDLACWCPLDKPCHADFLLEIANERESLDKHADVLRVTGGNSTELPEYPNKTP